LQVETDVRGSIDVILSRRPGSQLDGFACDCLFREMDTFRDPFYDMPIAIACRKIHFGIRLPGISAQDCLHCAHRLDGDQISTCIARMKSRRALLAK
jgi:hypothetical protein